MSFSARTDVDPAGLPVEETPVEDNAPTPFVGLQVWDIARLCHEANRAYCQAIGDDSQPPWSEAPEWQKTSAFDGVLFHLKNPNAGPAASHDNWSKTKIAEGWTYGPVKNPDLKEHPCLVPFTRLPREQQAKDSLFQGIVHALAPFVADEQDIFNVPT